MERKNPSVREKGRKWGWQVKSKTGQPFCCIQWAIDGRNKIWSGTFIGQC